MAIAPRSALVVDPGKVTGYGFLRWTPGDKDSVSFSGGELEHDLFVDSAFQWIQTGGLDLVLMEGFTINQRTAKEASSDEVMWSIKQIGVLQTFCRWYHTPFSRQMPSDKSFAAGSAKLKALGWWDGAKGEAGHRRDAARHAVVYATKNNIIDPRRLLG